MKLFLISQTVNNDWDTFDSAVVAAPDEEAARHMHPAARYRHLADAPQEEWGRDWADTPDQVLVGYLGEAAEGCPQGVICSSFNAG